MMPLQPQPISSSARLGCRRQANKAVCPEQRPAVAWIAVMCKVDGSYILPNTPINQRIDLNCLTQSLLEITSRIGSSGNSFMKSAKRKRSKEHNEWTVRHSIPEGNSGLAGGKRHPARLRGARSYTGGPNQGHSQESRKIGPRVLRTIRSACEDSAAMGARNATTGRRKLSPSLAN